MSEEGYTLSLRMMVFAGIMHSCHASSSVDSNAELRLLSSYRKLASPHRALVLSMTAQLLAAECSTRIDPQNVQEMQI